MNVMKKLAFLGAAAIMTAVFFSSVVRSAPEPTVVTAEMVAATLPVCKKAVEAARKGDSQYLQRAVVGIPAGSRGFVFMLCTAYAQGYADGRVSFPIA